MIARDCVKSQEMAKITKGQLKNYARYRAIIEDHRRLHQNNWSTPTLRVEGSNPFGHAKEETTHSGGFFFGVPFLCNYSFSFRRFSFFSVYHFLSFWADYFFWGAGHSQKSGQSGFSAKGDLF